MRKAPTHTIYNIRVEDRSATCEYCGVVSIHRGGPARNGTLIWKCASANSRKWRRGLNRPLARVSSTYRLLKADKCARCGFVPQHASQLDVDHIDEDHSNNDPSNLQTLCSNCHRLKTHRPDLLAA